MTTVDGLGRTIKAETGCGTTTVSVVETEYAPCACSPMGKVKRVSMPHAPSAEWGQSYTFDGFGNLLAQAVTKGSAPAMSLSVSGTTNRIITSGFSYYANGNMATMPQWSGSYDKEGRLVDATHSLNGSESYEYDASGLRIWKSTTTEAFVFYGPGGQRLANCRISGMQYWTGFTFDCKPITYFAGQVVTGEGDNAIGGNWGRAADRMGSTRAAPWGYDQFSHGVEASSYFPYGQARTGGSVFASYLPNTTTSTMYAMNREYSAVYGRFLTPDPYQASGGPADPGSWNRYSYVQGDPVNRYDSTGLASESAEPGLKTRDPGTPPVGGADGPPPSLLIRFIQASYLTFGVGTEDPQLWLDHQVGNRQLGSYLSTMKYFTELQATYRGRAAEAVRGLSDRGKGAFSKHIDMNALAAFAGTMTFYDSNDSIMGSWKVSDILGFGPSTDFTRLKEAAKGTYAMILPYDSGKISSNLVFGDHFFGATESDQNGTLVHEALHGALYLDDPQLAIALGLGDATNFPGTNAGQKAASASIRDYIRYDCAPVK